MKQFIFTLLLVIIGFGLHAQSITGKVTAADGKSISGSSISLLNTSKNIQTDKNGNFSLSGISAAKYILEISFVGYATQTKEVIAAANKPTEVAITLQEQSKQLNEVIVTSDKTETKLQQTPMAVSALNAQKLKDYRVWNITDLTALAPSLFVIEHGNSTSANFFNLRGTLGYTNEQAVATYVDGVYQFDFFSAPLNFNNIERIEILRGPQGTLYGRNAFGGVVNIITKKPTNTNSGFAEIDLGNHGQQRYSVGFNTPVIKNKLFFNASAQYNKRGAVYSNPTLNKKDWDSRKSVNANFNFKYVVSDKWRIDVNAKTESNNDNGAYPWVSSDSIARNEPYKAFGNWANTEKRNNTNASATVSHFGKHFNFTSVSGFIDYHLWYPDRFDLDYSAAKLFSGNGDFKQNQYTQEFRFSSPANNENWKWTVGSYLFTDKQKSTFRTFYEEDYAAVDPNAPYTAITYGSRKNKGFAFFGQATYSINSKLDITAGTRYDAERKERTESNVQEKNETITPLSPAATDIKTFNAFTPKVVLSYKLNEQSLLYASYAKGFRIGGFNIGSTNTSTKTYNPEKSDNYEIAIKNNLLQNKLKLNITAFYLQQKDQQVTTSTNGLDFVTLNIGDMNNFGIETEITAIPFKNLQVEWNAAFSKAEYAKLILYDYASSSTKNYKGNKPIYNPDFSSMIAAQHNIAFKNSKQNMAAFIRGEYRYIGKYYYDFLNTESETGYGLINARTGITAKNFEIAIWGRNLNNARYITWGTFGSYLLGSPSMWGVTLTGKF